MPRQVFSKQSKIFETRFFLSRFSRLPEMSINGRPLWEQLDGDNFFFYTSTRHWLVGPDFNRSTGCVHSKDMFLERIPVRGWQYAKRRWNSAASSLSLWVEDPLITVDGEEHMRNRSQNLRRGVDRAGHSASDVMLIRVNILK